MKKSISLPPITVSEKDLPWLPQNAEVKLEDVLEVLNLNTTSSTELTLDELVLGEDMTPHTQTSYEQWLAGEAQSIVAQLAQAYEDGTLTTELNAEFVTQFKRFLNGPLLMKLKRNYRQRIEMTPVELTVDGYKEMKHPYLNGSWNVSMPVNLVPNIERFTMGDIVSTYQFNESRSAAHLTSIIFLHLDDAQIIPQTLKEALGELVQPAFFDDLQRLGLGESVEAALVRTLVGRSEDMKASLKEALAEQQQLEADLADKRRTLQQEQDKLSVEEQSWISALAEVKRLMASEDEQQREEVEILPYNSKTFIQDLQKLYLHNNDVKALVYEETLIRKFFYSLQANILTVLSGPSGTGKSSIIESLADCVENVKVKMISVQSSWTDATDLLGYFHPNDKTFVPTPFMEALVEAVQNPNEIHIICLDEMNLAHVEYYFSEILSAREKKKPSIYLYPNKHLQMAKLVLQDETASTERKRNAAELLTLYPPEFILPDNVRFVGTLNMDHTVKPLSPKVVDRSFIIEVNHLEPKKKKALKQKLDKDKMTGKINYDYAQFTQTHLVEKDYKKLVEEIEALGLLFEKHPNVPLNSRGMKHMEAFFSFAETPAVAKSLVDSVVYGKLLPRIEVKRAVLEEDIPAMTRALATYTESQQKWDAMLQKPYTVNFW